MKRIESRNNPLIVNTGKLANRKHRLESGKFFFEGAHLLEEYLRFGFVPDTVFVCDGADEKYSELLSRIPEDRICSVPLSVFEKISTEQAPQGLLTVSEFLPCVKRYEEDDVPDGKILLLQSVRDNGNVGTVIRTAAAFGWNCVLTQDCADVYASKTVRATMGTLFSGTVSVCADPIQFVRALRHNGRRVFGAALGERQLCLGSFDLKQDDCFIVGNEGRGISPELLSACDSAVLIPMTGKAESLNASVAASVIMWEGARDELRRQ